MKPLVPQCPHHLDQGVEAGDGGGALRERTCVEGAGVVGGTGALLSNEPVERCRQLGFF